MTRHSRLKSRAVDLAAELGRPVCCYSGCWAEPEDDTWMCERHAEDHRERMARSRARLRAYRVRQARLW
jgi:hypothetical protein